MYPASRGWRLKILAELSSYKLQAENDRARATLEKRRVKAAVAAEKATASGGKTGREEAHEIIELDVRIAEAEVSISELALQQSRIISPIQGIVARKLKLKSGEIVDPLQPLEIINTDLLYAHFYVGPELIKRLKPPGKDLEVWLRGKPEKKWNARSGKYKFCG